MAGSSISRRPGRRLLVLVLVGFAAVVALACVDGGARSPTPNGDSLPAAGCDEGADPVARILCFADRASAEHDVSVCDDAEDEGVTYQCYAVVAERRADVAPCFQIPATTDERVQLRDACVGDVAVATEREELCQQVSTPGLRDSCYLRLAQSSGETALCARIDDAGLKSACTGEPVDVD